MLDAVSHLITGRLPATQVTPVKEDDLETILLRMTGVGRPRLCQASDGKWYCHCAMAVAVVGTSLEVKSEWDCESPLAAAKQCEERIKETVSKFGR